MSDNPKTHEWKLLKEQFDALVHNEGLRQDSLEQFLDNAIRYRCGRLLAWAAETKTKANDGALPPDLRRANEVPYEHLRSRKFYLQRVLLPEHSRFLFLAKPVMAPTDKQKSIACSRSLPTQACRRLHTCAAWAIVADCRQINLGNRSSRPFRRNGVLAFEQRLSRFRASANWMTIA